MRRWLIAVVALGLWGVACILSTLVFPNFQEATFTVSGGQPKQKAWPFIIAESPQGMARWDLPISLQALHPTVFSICGDGFLHSVNVNGIELKTAALPQVLQSQTPVTVDLRPYLRPGKNHITAYVQQGAGYAAFRPFIHPLDPLHLSLLAIISAALVLTLHLMHLCKPEAFPWEIVVILSIGILVRVFYVNGTPYYTRSYDLWGHVEYIKYVASHLTIPPFDHGWETHQPPLYYLICGLWTSLSGQENSSWLYGQWQLLSLMMSIATLLLCVPIARLLFRDQNESIQRALFLLLLAVYPGLIYVSARISNDALFSMLSFAWFLLLLRSWDTPSPARWGAVCLALGAGMLVKNVALVLIGITCLCLAFHPRLKTSMKIAALGGLALIVFAVAGWYQIPRAVKASNATSFVVAIHELEDSLRIPRSIANILTFNPLEVVRIPFVNSRSDETRRMYFFEYFFKSSLFGEWVWGRHLVWPARILVLNAVMLLPLAIIGLVRNTAKRSFWLLPLTTTAAALLGASMLYVWRCPFACNQDFRFQTLLLIPISYFAVRGAEFSSTVGTVTVVFFGVNAVLFEMLLLLL